MPALRARRLPRRRRAGLPGFVVCTVSREQAWRVLNPQTECENGRFQTASDEIVQKRGEWLEKLRRAKRIQNGDG